jgi:hypothetical protein
MKITGFYIILKSPGLLRMYGMDLPKWQSKWQAGRSGKPGLAAFLGHQKG